MATATTAKDKTANKATTGLMAQMSEETAVVVPARGRGYAPDVIAIREALDKMVEERTTVRSFTNVEPEEKDEITRKIRSAAKMKGKTEIKVQTRYDKEHKKVVWGPEDLMNELASKNK